MTILAEVTSTDQLDGWHDLGATYTVLWDVGNKVSLDVYNVNDRPLFVTIGPDMVIRTRRPNEGGMNEAEQEALRLLGQ